MKFDALVNHLLKENIDEPQQLGITCYDDGTCKRVQKSATYYYKTYVGNTPLTYHRLDGPAIIHKSGSKEWYVDGRRHRLDGPACEENNGTKSWWVNGRLHREDGPAFINADGHKEWYVNNKELTKEEFDEYLKKKEITKEIQSHKNNRIDPGMLEDYL